jgi:hypothetical protein
MRGGVEGRPVNDSEGVEVADGRQDLRHDGAHTVQRDEFALGGVHVVLERAPEMRECEVAGWEVEGGGRREGEER